MQLTDQSLGPAADPLTELALTKPGVIGRVAATPKQSFTTIASQLSPQQLERATDQCKSISRRIKAKQLEQRLLLGAVLYVLQQLHASKGSGGFKRCLMLANIERGFGYRCVALFELFGDYCQESTELLTRFSIEAAQALATKSTPTEIRNHFIAKARAGEDVSYTEVKRVIAAHKQPSLTNDTRLADRYREEEAKIDSSFATGTTQEQIKRHFALACNRQLQKSFGTTLAPQEVPS